MKKKMTGRDKTFWAVIIPVLVLFFTFNTLPMIKGLNYSLTTGTLFGCKGRKELSFYLQIRIGGNGAGKCAQPGHGAGVKRQDSL